MKKIDISTKKYPNTFALVDDEDYERINKYHWYVAKSKRRESAQRCIYLWPLPYLRLHMSREVMRYVGSKFVDHINHNALDNRKDNLRLCTKSQNAANSRKYKIPTSSKYRGVYWEKRRSRWTAQIKKDDKHIFIGRYKIEKDAAIAFNRKALELFGDFANLNIFKEVVL